MRHVAAQSIPIHCDPHQHPRPRTQYSPAMRRILLALCLTLLATPAGADPAAGVVAHMRGDFKAAYREWKPLADQGNARAQWGLALLYKEGQGVPQDYAEAAKWARKAADQGFAAASAVHRQWI